MKIELLKAVLVMGDKYGSGIREMLSDLRICDFTNVTDQQATYWLERKSKNDSNDNSENKKLCD